MKPWSFRKKFVFGIVFIFIGLMIYKGFESYRDNKKNGDHEPQSKNEILHLEINGVIMNGKKFLSQLKRDWDQFRQRT